VADQTNEPSQALLRLTAAYGVVPDFWGFDGSHRQVGASTLIAVLDALGVDASSPERIDVAITHVEDMPWRRTLPPVVVVRQGRHAHVPVHVPHGDPVGVWLELDAEAGGGRRDLVQADVLVDPRSVDGRLMGRATFTIPTDLPLGWHVMQATGPSASARSVVVVTPSTLELPEQLRTGRAWGFMAQLYSVRSRASWGVGDFADLAELGWLSARTCGADFLLVNPLHSAEPAGPMTPSPYLPTTRRFVSPLYIRVEDVRETAYLSAADRLAVHATSRSIGIMHDLAVGVHPEGADVWALGDVLARGATVGAPPDMYNQQGQNWSQPPWRPDELARVAYRPYRDLLRTVLRHAGAIRIDHVIGLFRLWWIPEGAAAGEGAYVRYDHEALIGILALEAHRAGAVVIGEDLGVFEPWVRDYLTERGILGTSILWFEKDQNGRPLAPEHYRRLALASVTTHDLPPTAGYLAEEHVALRERLGLLTEPVADVRAQARAEREEMVAVLRGRGLVGADPSERELVEALHRLILATPAALIGVSLADAVGERRAQNQPGTDQEYPNWKVPLADGSGQVVLIEDLFSNPRLRSLAAALNRG
jgi:4-alpha-glucanotransferase